VRWRAYMMEGVRDKVGNGADDGGGWSGQWNKLLT